MGRKLCAQGWLSHWPHFLLEKAYRGRSTGSHTQFCLEPVPSTAMPVLPSPSWAVIWFWEALQSGPRMCISRPRTCPDWEHLLRDRDHVVLISVPPPSRHRRANEETTNEGE